MATKFSSLYKQELKSRGALESLGSTVVKSMAERVDLRNVLFGGKGFVAKTGRKIFGKGYDPIERAKRITPDSSAAVAAVATLQESNKRQEDALKIIVKNTMNMNMMARDMNITRQNIASLTKAVTGKSSKGADALWMNAARRDREDKSTAPTKVGGSSNSILSGVLGGVMGIGGSAGSMIFRALGSIIAISPIVGIVGIAAAGYAIKKMAEDIDFKGMFESVKNNIMKFLGIDPDSDEPILRQLASKLDAVFSTTRFTDIYDWVDKTFSEDFRKIRKMIEDGTSMLMAYSEAAFRVLGDNFAKVGEIFSFHFKNFINQYKPELLTTLGAAIGGSVGSLFGIKGAALGLLIGSAAGWITGQITKTRSTEDIEKDLGEARRIESLHKKRIEESYVTNAKGELEVPFLKRGQLEESKKGLQFIQSRILGYEEELAVQRSRMESMRIAPGNFPGSSNFQQYLNESLEKQGLSTSPERISNNLSTDILNKKFIDLNQQEKEALLAAQARAEGYGKPGTLPTRMNNPGAMLYGDFAKSYGAQPGDSNVAGQFAKFPTVEQGIEAQRALWESNSYRNLSIREAIKKWTGGERNQNSYDELIAKAITSVPKAQGQIISQASSDLATTQRGASTNSPPIIQNINNTAASKPASQNMPSPQAYNMDAAELFFAPLLRGIN